MIRVVVVDDQLIVREGIVLLLGMQPDIEIVGQVSDGADVVPMVRDCTPDVVVMDVRMPGMDGVAATAALAADGALSDRVTKVLVLTTYRDDDVVYGALRAGANGFMVKDSPPDQLIQAVRAVAAGGSWIDPSVAGRVIEVLCATAPSRVSAQALVDLLTPREREVLTLMAQGLSNGEICERWVVSEATVKTHVGRVLFKTGSRDRAGAVVFAYQHGLVSVSPARGGGPAHAARAETP